MRILAFEFWIHLTYLIDLIMERFISLIGLLTFIAIAFGLCNHRSAIRWQPVLWGIALQFILAVVILRVPGGRAVFDWLGAVVTRFLDYAAEGSKFVFGANYAEFFFAFKVLPTIIFFSAFMSLLYHYGIIQQVMRGIAWVMVRTMKTSGGESLSVAGNIFVGPTEAPLLIKPYVVEMTQSELFAVMVGGFATIAGGVLGAYISFNAPAEHLLAASVMSAPAALAMAKLMYPETEQSLTVGEVKMTVERTSVNAIDAIAIGTLDGLKLALNVGAMLIAFLGLLALVNGFLSWFGGLFNVPQFSLEWILSYVMAPFAWLMGIPWEDVGQVAVLLGKKTIFNEFIAYADLQKLIQSNSLSQRSIDIATYALCGFANIGTVGITIGGLGGIAPTRQHDIARLGMIAMVAGALANFMTAAIAGILL